MRKISEELLAIRIKEVSQEVELIKKMEGRLVFLKRCCPKKMIEGQQADTRKNLVEEELVLM